MMYSSYSALQRRQLTKQVYTDTQSSYLLVYAPGRHLALENSLANQLHRKFRLVTALEGELTDSVAGVLLVSEEACGDIEQDESFIMRKATDEDGNPCFQSLDDEKLIERIYEAYLEQSEER